MISNKDTFHPYGAMLSFPDGDIILVAGNNITITPAGGTLTIASQVPPGVLFSGIPWQPPMLADSKTPNNSIYFSTDAGKLVYKDSASVVHNLY